MNCPECNRHIRTSDKVMRSCDHHYGKYKVYYVARDTKRWITIWAYDPFVFVGQLSKWIRLSEKKIEAIELLK